MYWVESQVQFFGDFFRLFGQTARQLGVFPWRGQEILKNTVQIGLGSLPIIVVATVFAGLVVTNEIVFQMDHALHNITMVPGFTGQFVIRELGIAIPALLVVSKVGASITAEVGTMKITEQLDALKLLRINPVAYLVFPRWLACIFSLACLTIISIGVTLLCALLVAVLYYNFNSLEYLNNLRKFIEPVDLVYAMIKAMVFGAVIPIVSCVFGFRCGGGAQGVGTATTNAVVTSTIAVIVLDFVLTYLFSFAL